MADWTTSPFYATAVNAAQQYGIPPDLFVAQIGAESSFNPSAYNSYGPGAYGIAQFQPATAAQYGVNVNDPTSSLYGAAQYTSDLYKRFGNWAQALESYGTTSGSTLGPNAQSAANIASSYDALPDWFKDPFGVANATKDVQGVVKTVGSLKDFFAFIGNIPRMATAIAGLILLFIGLAAFGFRPAMQVISNVKDAALPS
jgi:soluble lytic murein transglycosylase-like protein